jgi:hypothetical protein
MELLSLGYFMIKPVFGFQFNLSFIGTYFRYSSRVSSALRVVKRLLPVESKFALKMLAPKVCDLHRARAAQSQDPLELQQSSQHGRAQRTGDMRFALAPIETRACKRAPVVLKLGDIDAERTEPGFPAVRDFKRFTVVLNKTVVHERLGETHSQFACQVVVAGPRPLNGFSLQGIVQRTRLGSRSNERQGFQHFRHLFPAQAEVTVPAHARHSEQIALYEFGEVRTGRLRRDSCQPG